MIQSEQSDILHNTYPLHILKCESRGGDRGSGSPEKSQSYLASIQCWANIDPSAKRQLNGVSLAGLWWPICSDIWILYTLNN